MENTSSRIEGNGRAKLFGCAVPIGDPGQGLPQVCVSLQTIGIIFGRLAKAGCCFIEVLFMEETFPVFQ